MQDDALSAETPLSDQTISSKTKPSRDGKGGHLDTAVVRYRHSQENVDRSLRAINRSTIYLHYLDALLARIDTRKDPASY